MINKIKGYIKSKLKKTVIEAISETFNVSKYGIDPGILRREIESVVNETMIDLRKGSQM